MDKQIAVHSGEQSRAMPMEQGLALLREAMVNPDVQPEKATAMAELIFRMEDRGREAAFIAAKTAAIAAMPRIGQDGYNSHLKSRYAKWETMQPIVNRVLAERGLALSFEVGGDGVKMTVRPILQGHGWTERGDAMPLPADDGPGRSKVQGVGSTISYGKRYSAMAMLNLLQAGSVEDDDGEATAGRGREYSEAQELLISDGNMAARKGVDAYADWFKTLSATQRGWLVEEGKHDELKKAAGAA